MTLERQWLVVGWLGIAAVIHLSLMPAPPQLPVEQGDKSEHVAAHFASMHWFAQLVVVRGDRLRLALAPTGLGIGREFAQVFAPGRSCDVADMLADGAAWPWAGSPRHRFDHARAGWRPIESCRRPRLPDPRSVTAPRTTRGGPWIADDV